MSAEILCSKGVQVISFDLPEHGERKNHLPIHTVKQAIDDMQNIMNYAKQHYDTIDVIGCSLGAYYTLLAYINESIRKANFLSPVVDLIELTHEMLENDNRSISDVYLHSQITLSNGIIVRLEDYEYLQNHKIDTIRYPISILYGSKDTLIRKESIINFIHKYPCELIVSENSAHYFYTEEDMKHIKDWLNHID